MNISQEKYRRSHFIGIGGIGVSALAQFYLARGVEVSGWDARECENIIELRKLGVKIVVGQGKESDSPFLLSRSVEAGSKGKIVDLVVYSAAVPQDNPELVEARRRGIKCQTYAQALGELTKKYFTIAVSGMHGKSTTTAMIGLILEEAGLDPTVIVGTKVGWKNQKSNIKNQKLKINAPRFNSLLIEERGKIPPSPPLARGGEAENVSNFRYGESKYLVIEADEYNRSMLNYWPKIMVLTNLEEEHLDTYKDLGDILKTFAEYVGHLEKDGVLVANGEDVNISKIKNQKSKLRCKIQNYNADTKIQGLKLQIPGRHNLSNAAAAIAVARLLNIPDEISIKTLNNFNGTWRRMEYKGQVNGAKIYDDYGHHPTEIKATLEGARDLIVRHRETGGRSNLVVDGNTTGSSRPCGARDDSDGRLWCVFQPHQYQRTHQLFNKFVDAFGDADKLILLPIYSVAGRERDEIKKKVSSEKLAESIIKRNQGSGIINQEVLYFDLADKAKRFLKGNLKNGDVCIIMGAGDIYLLTRRLMGDKDN